MNHHIDPVVKTHSGYIRGYFYENVYQFKNIKFAQAKRFESPQPFTWEGVRECKSYGYAPPLLNENDISNDYYVPHYYWPTDEDCLNLNIWSPALSEKEGKPVVVGIFGGSFETGYSAEMLAYDGTNLSREGDLVFVSLNMRINMLGFFDLSCFEDGYQNSGNLGFEDILLGLKWIKENIKSFGGDPDNITIFGSQGGGLRIRYLIQCPALKGLFHKVFNLSGVADHGRPQEPAKYRELALKMLEYGGFDKKSVKPLKDMALEDLFQLYHKTLKKENMKFRWRPSLNDWSYGRVEDEGVCPEMTGLTIVLGHTLVENRFLPEQHPDGRVSMEHFQLEAKKMFKEDAEEIVRLFGSLYPDMDIRDSLYFSEDHCLAVHEYALRESEAGNQIFAYVFCPEFPVNGGIPAYHCSDVAYIMRNLAKVPAVAIPGLDQKIMEAYSGTLIALAHGGSPWQEGMPEWKQYRKEQPNIMWIGKEVMLRTIDDSIMAQKIQKHRNKK